MATKAAQSTRPYKGESLLSSLSDYVVFDLETTGLDPIFDEIIEIGAIRYENDIEVDRFQALVKPYNAIDEFISELTGITNEMVESAPPIADVLPLFRSFIGDSPLIGHNAHFDINFVYDESAHLALPPLTNDFIDTLRIARRLYPELPNRKLHTICEHLNVCQPVEHRALADCIRTQKCYVAMRPHLDKLAATSHRSRVVLKASEIVATTDVFDLDSPIFGRAFTFTGSLQRMVRKEAMQAVVNAGGQINDSVTKKTNYLVLGNNDYCASIKDGKSNKQKKAESLQLAGNDIQVISEDVFYEMLALSAPLSGEGT